MKAFQLVKYGVPSSSVFKEVEVEKPTLLKGRQPTTSSQTKQQHLQLTQNSPGRERPLTTTSTNQRNNLLPRFSNV